MANEAVKLEFDAQNLRLTLSDQRLVVVPLSRYPSLLKSTPADRRAYRIFGHGQHIHWSRLDLDLLTEQIVNGEPEQLPPPPSASPAARGRHRELHVRLEPKQGKWSVLPGSRGRRPWITCPTREEAKAEAITLGRMYPSACVFVHRRDGKLARTIKLGAAAKAQSA